MNTAASTARDHDLCHEIAQTHPPANAYERMLLEQVANSWERLQRATDLERRWSANRDLVEVLRTKPDEFKTITRYVTDCERAWRHGLLNLEAAQRRREREAKAAATAATVVRRAGPPPTPEPRAAAPLPLQPSAEIRPARRE